MKKWFGAFVLLAAFAATAGSMLVLTGGSAEAASRVISGHGTLSARGSGVAQVKGDGRIEIRGAGEGVAVICGAEHVEANGNGTRSDMPDGCVRFQGWGGTIVATGEDMNVKMAGRKVQFTASGSGSAFLRGRGVFHVGHVSGLWTRDGVTVEYNSDDQAR